MGSERFELTTRVLIIGGGAAGTSIAYHLARRGCSDVVLLEASSLASGSTWHAAGMCPQFNSSVIQAQLLKYGLELYDGALEADTGQSVGFHRCGSIRLATTPDRLDEYLHYQGMARSIGVRCELIGSARIASLFPFAALDDVAGALYFPTDGHVDPSSLVRAYAEGARRRGVRIITNAHAAGFERVGGAWRVETSQGSVTADVVVNAAGQWAREVGRLAGVELPLVPLEHQYVVTEAIPEIAAREGELPILRDVDASFYLRQEGRGLLVGPFERRPAPWAVDAIPEDFHGRLLAPELDRIEDVLVAAAARVPPFGRAGLKSVINGPDAYTPDGRCLMGPIPGRPGLHVLAGFSIFGIVFSGGAGLHAADWILDGEPGLDLWELNVARFGPYASSSGYVVARAREVYEREYAIKFPHMELPAGRPLKTDPLYDRLRERGAVFGARYGWERPLWFARDVPAADRDSFRRTNWHGPVGFECRTVRSAVGVLDQSSMSKYEIHGDGAATLLDRLGANVLPERMGRTRLVQMCTPQGGIVCDVTITRLGPDRFYVVTAAFADAHDQAWIERHMPDRGVHFENVSGRYGVLTIAGPRSRELLARLVDVDVSNAAFPFLSARELRVAMAPVRVMRLNYAGELGYELHHPFEYQRHLYDAVLDAGADLGVVDFGYRALDSMRLEKSFRLWGVDLSPQYTPLEAGLARFVRFDKGDFIGRDALLRQRDAGITRSLCSLVIDADGSDAVGGEPVLLGDRVLSYVLTGGFGHTVDASIALAYLPIEHATPGTALRVEILGEERTARVVAEPVYETLRAESAPTAVRAG